MVLLRTDTIYDQTIYLPVAGKGEEIDEEDVSGIVSSVASQLSIPYSPWRVFSAKRSPYVHSLSRARISKDMLDTRV